MPRTKEKSAGVDVLAVVRGLDREAITAQLAERQQEIRHLKFLLKISGGGPLRRRRRKTEA